MSSAILYVAIVVIWAGVLIPRWLRRDTSAATAVCEPESGAEEPAEESERVEEMAGAGQRLGPSSRGRRRPPVEAGGAGVDGTGSGRTGVDGTGVDGTGVDGTGVDGTGRRPAGSPRRDRDRDRAHMLSARRRLLGLLVLLAVASGALAERRLAAWWVVLPPIVMLLGYLGLLREASKADAERLRAARSRAAREPVAAVRPGAASAGAVPADVPEVDERRAEVIEISATWEQAEEEELYDQDADAKRRAVGD